MPSSEGRGTLKPSTADVCCLEQRRFPPGSTVQAMIFKNVRLIVVAAYVLTVVVAAVASGVRSSAGLIVFIAIALLPSGALLLWNDPPQTLSETIQAARR